LALQPRVKDSSGARRERLGAATVNISVLHPEGTYARQVTAGTVAEQDEVGYPSGVQFVGLDHHDRFLEVAARLDLTNEKLSGIALARWIKVSGKKTTVKVFVRELSLKLGVSLP
jgi:hypothetical protein